MQIFTKTDVMIQLMFLRKTYNEISVQFKDKS